MTTSAATRERIKAAVPVVLIHVAGVLLVLNSFDVPLPDIVRTSLQVVDILPPPPPPPVPPPAPQPVHPNTNPGRIADPRPEGGAAPPNLRSSPTPIVAPPPVLPVPTPLPAAQTPATGFDRSAGAAEIAGPGPGAGGFGYGSGSGSGGDGDGGGGGGGGGYTPPRHVRGSLSINDLPQTLVEAGAEGTVGVRYVVQADGSVTDCIVEDSSGNRALDALTCRLIEQRFRFRPSLDRAGRPVRSQLIENHTWEVDRLPPERRTEQRRRRFPF